MCTVIPYSYHSRRTKLPVSEAEHVQNLVVSKCEGSLHLLEAYIHRVVTAIFQARLATNEVRDEWPSVISKSWMTFGHVLLVLPDQIHPVAMEIVGILEKHLGRPFLSLRDEQVDKSRLIVSLKTTSSSQALGQHFS